MAYFNESNTKALLEALNTSSKLTPAEIGAIKNGLNEEFKTLSKDVKEAITKANNRLKEETTVYDILFTEQSNEYVTVVCEINHSPKAGEDASDVASSLKDGIMKIKKDLSEKHKDLSIKLRSGSGGDLNDFVYYVKKGWESSICIYAHIPASKCKKYINSSTETSGNSVDISKIVTKHNDEYKSVSAKFFGHNVYIESDNIDEVAKSLNDNVAKLNSLFNSKYKDNYYQDIANEANKSDNVNTWNSSNIKSKVKEEVYYTANRDNDFYVKIIASCNCKKSFGAEFVLRLKNGKDSFSFEYTDTI